MTAHEANQSNLARPGRQSVAGTMKRTKTDLRSSTYYQVGMHLVESLLTWQGIAQGLCPLLTRHTNNYEEKVGDCFTIMMVHTYNSEPVKVVKTSRLIKSIPAKAKAITTSPLKNKPYR